MSIPFSKYLAKIDQLDTVGASGKILRSVGMVFEAYLPKARLGSLCRIEIESQTQGQPRCIAAEVIGFRDKRAVLMGLEESVGVQSESRVWLEQVDSNVTLSQSLLGRVVDARGVPIDGKGPLRFGTDSSVRSIYQKPIQPLKRQLIHEPLDLGIRAINSLMTCARGQRMGIFSGSGVGKSVLLGMISRYTKADVNVIALIGERAREVREFIENELGEEGLSRSIVVVSTADESPLLRMRGAFLAATIAEYFRDQEKHVLLLMDSLTRFSMAQREIGLSLGEPPATRGYTPSVFSTLPKLLERAGTGISSGTVTGLYTVLVEGDDLDDPIADSARSILDGHIVLSRKLAQRHHFPPIDVLASISRLMPTIVSSEHRQLAAKIRESLALYAQVEDLLALGAYQKGSNPTVDEAISLQGPINQFLKQDLNEFTSLSEGIRLLNEIKAEQVQVGPTKKRLTRSSYFTLGLH